MAEGKKNRVWKGLGLGALALVGSCVGLSAFASHRVKVAAREINAFCAEIVAGQELAGLAEKAGGRGFKVMNVPPIEKEPAKIIIWDGVGFARRFCNVSHADGRVLRADTNSLD